MKTKLLQLHNFIQRELYPDSRQYFDKRFYLAYELITFNNNEITHWDNKSEIQFSCLIDTYPLIDKLIFYRQEAKGLEDYCESSYEILSGYLKKTKNKNIRYNSNFFNWKEEETANNLVKGKRIEFFKNIETIFYMIEKSYSIELKKNTEKIKKKVKSEYNLIALKYMILNEFKKMPFEWSTYVERNEKIVQKESSFYKEVINVGSVKGAFKNIEDFKLFLKNNNNLNYIEALKEDTDIAKENEILLFLDNMKKNLKKN